MSDTRYTSSLLKYTQYKNAIISISPGCLTFSVHSPDVKHILLFNQFSFSGIKLEDEQIRNIQNVISSESLFKEKFNKVDVAFISQKSTLVPDEFFVKENLKQYFEFAQNMSEYDEIHYSAIPEIGASTVFTLPSMLTGSLLSIQPGVRFHHQSASLIRFGSKMKTKSHVSVVLGLNTDFFDMAIFQDGKLTLYNTFQYTNATDLVYFFLYTCKQLKIDHKEIIVFAFGEALLEKNLLRELKKYVKDIERPLITLPFEIKPLQREDFVKYYLHSFLCL